VAARSDTSAVRDVRLVTGEAAEGPAPDGPDVRELGVRSVPELHDDLEAGPAVEVSEHVNVGIRARIKLRGLAVADLRPHRGREVASFRRDDESETARPRRLVLDDGHVELPIAGDVAAKYRPACAPFRRTRAARGEGGADGEQRYECGGGAHR
jgi:hypothetical protein